MYVLVAYDVATSTPEGTKRLRRIAKVCLDFGQRVQKSLFELKVDPAQWADCRQKLIAEIDPEVDSLRFYFLGANWKRRVEHAGVVTSFDVEGPLIV